MSRINRKQTHTHTLCRCSSDIFLSSRPRTTTGFATAYITRYIVDARSVDVKNTHTHIVYWTVERETYLRVNDSFRVLVFHGGVLPSTLSQECGEKNFHANDSFRAPVFHEGDVISLPSIREFKFVLFHLLQCIQYRLAHKNLNQA